MYNIVILLLVSLFRCSYRRPNLLVEQPLSDIFGRIIREIAPQSALALVHPNRPPQPYNSSATPLLCSPSPQVYRDLCSMIYSYVCYV